MSKEFPFYPELTEEAQKQAQVLIDKFKVKIHEVVGDVLGEFYCDVMPYIESDTWSNFRNEIMDGFRDYNNRIKAEYDFKKIRRKILEDNKSNLIQDLNQDLVQENERLKKTIETLQEMRRHY